MFVGHPREGNLESDEFRALGVAGILEEVGVDQPRAVVVVVGEYRIEKRLLIRERHGAEYTPDSSEVPGRYNTPGSFGSTARSPRNDLRTSTTDR